ncbi:MAG TPA: M4 family metallopeptidase [Pyrinomonadaceae bacterium]
MAQSKDATVREAALRTLVTSARVRGQREIVGRVRAALTTNPPGEKTRVIHDAEGKFLNEFELPGKLVGDESNPPSGGGAAAQAFDGLGATYDFFSEVLDRNSIDDRGMRLVATVHFGAGYNNAFWNGRQMVFGDGDNIIFKGFTRSLDVIGHELTHGVTDYTAKLVYHKQPGALNESFSDVFGSLIKQYAADPKQTADEADWLIGAGLLADGINGVALRSMKDPGSAYDDPQLGGRDPQPKHMSDYRNMPDDEWNDWGGVHINSGIPNHAFYLVARQLGGYAWEDAGLIWYNALLQLWEMAQFQDCANITAQVAGAVFGAGSAQQQAVREAWAEVGINITAPAATKSRGKGGTKPPYESNGAALKKQLEQMGEVFRRAAEVA